MVFAVTSEGNEPHGQARRSETRHCLPSLGIAPLHNLKQQPSAPGGNAGVSAHIGAALVSARPFLLACLFVAGPAREVLAFNRLALAL
jgi:hypothetical protein